jgi:hypothetical protein
MNLPSLNVVLAHMHPEMLEKRRASLLEEAERHGVFKVPTEAEILREAKRQAQQQNPELVQRARQRRDQQDRTRALVELDQAVENLYYDVQDALLAQRQEAAISAGFEHLYDEAVENLQGVDGADCFRIMALPAKQDPATLQRLGIFWAHDESGAGDYFANDEQQREQRGDLTVMYRGKVDRQHIDVMGTLVANLTNPQESEVRFNPGSPIYVYDVFCLDEKCADVTLEDWRRC